MLVITAFLCKVITFMTLQEHTFNTPAKFHLMAEEATKCRLISKQKMYISYNMKSLLLNIDIKVRICCQNHIIDGFKLTFH